MMWKILPLVIAGAILSACTSAAPAQAQANPAPSWTLPTLDGSTFALADHRGEVVVMYFMASWCGSCIPEAQSLAQLHRQYGSQGLTVVAIDAEAGQPVADLQLFKQRVGNSDYEWVFDSNLDVARLYKVQSLDATIIIDRDGNIVYSDASPTPLTILEAEITRIL